VTQPIRKLGLVAAWIALSLAVAFPFALPARGQPEDAPAEAVPVPAPASLLSGKLRLFFAPDPSTAAESFTGNFVAFAKSAKRTLDVAMFEVDEPAFIAALLERHEKGVRVRVVIDAENYKEDKHKDLKAAGILVVDTRTALMHSKLMAADGERIYGGSANATVSALTQQDNDGFFIESPELAARVEKFVEDMFEKKLFGHKRETPGVQPVKLGTTTVELSLSPEDKPLDRVVAEVAAAKKSIRFLAFNMSHKDLTGALADAVKRGVKVRGVCAKVNAYTGGAALATKGVKVYLDGTGAFMHSKFIIVDEKVVVTGSFNFSLNATDNEEDLFVIRSAAVAKRYGLAYSRVEDGAEVVKTPGVAASVPH
jgi:phosphatidylserine/phosphatidylglycerophosphate/cardiolipin synthase-like enzyme